MNKSLTVAFLGPDGSGKSTIIDGLTNQELGFEQIHYFHLKPIAKNGNESQAVVEDPHALKPYGALKSYLKLLFFVYQYHVGWYHNIRTLKRTSSLVIFDRYYDDLLVDFKRYRYGGSLTIAKMIRNLIPRPKLYFILTAPPEVIFERKKEVPFEELERQIKGYRSLADGNKYISIDVNRSPEEIITEVSTKVAASQ